MWRTLVEGGVLSLYFYILFTRSVAGIAQVLSEMGGKTSELLSRIARCAKPWNIDGQA